MFRFHLEVPSTVVMDIELGEVFEDSDGKKYMLMSRDPWKARIARYTWYDRIAVKVIEKLLRLKPKPICKKQ